MIRFVLAVLAALLTAPALAQAPDYGPGAVPPATGVPGDITSFGPSGWPAENGAATVTARGAIQFKSSMNLLSRLSQTAAVNNPRVNPVMTSPPAITAAPLWSNGTAYTVGQVVVNPSGSGASSLGYWYVATTAGTSSASCCGPSGTGTGITDGTVVWNYVSSHPTAKYSGASAANSYLWNTGTGLAGPGGVVNFLGGVPANNASTGCEISNTATVAGAQSGGGGRWNFVTDATYIVLRVFNVGPSSTYRVIVNAGTGPQYASLTPVTLAPGGWGYLLIDFSSAGGRATRDITIENESNTYFCGVDVAVTEGVYKPGRTTNNLTIVHVGDSFTAAAGADMVYDGYAFVLCDYAGATNCIDLGIGSTGYVDSSTSGTAIQRINDVISAVNYAGVTNSIIIDENGYDDQTYSASSIQAACLAYLQALRAQYPTIPIFELGINAAGNGGTSWAVGIGVENAKKAAVAAMNDPLIVFIPSIQAVGGSMMTGTGNDQARNGTGNSDYYTNGLTLPHSNTPGHAYMAQQWLYGMRQALLGGWY